MTILSRDRLLALHRAPSLATNEDVSGILDMLDAMQRALGAWVKLEHIDPNLYNSGWYDQWLEAKELTEQAGIDWLQEGVDDNTEQG